MSETLGILVHGGDSYSREPRPSLFTANIFVLVAVCLLAQPLLLSFLSVSDSSLTIQDLGAQGYSRQHL